MAAFGLARIRAARGDVDGAVAGYRLVPAESSAYPAARAGLAELLTRANRTLGDLAEAMKTMEGTSMTSRHRAEVATQIYREALARVSKGGSSPQTLIGTRRATVPQLRLGLEESLRELASHTPELGERVRLVDEANTIRPWSIW
jgi:serine/threonine-protein kinase PknG